MGNTAYGAVSIGQQQSAFTAAATFFTLFGDEYLVILALGLLLGFIYEEKKVNFEKAEKWWSYIVRPVLGVVIFAVVSILLKLPAKAISAEWLELTYRLFRYAVSTFVIIGLYPHLFKKFKI